MNNTEYFYNTRQTDVQLIKIDIFIISSIDIIIINHVPFNIILNRNAKK